MGALKKLEIVGYKDNKFLSKTGHSFTVMVNPGSYRTRKQIQYAQCKLMDGGNLPTYQGFEDEEMHFEFVLDDTGALIDWKNLANLNIMKPLPTLLDELQQTVYDFDGDSHETPYLKVMWGTLSFDARMKNLNISYMLQTAEGKPVRAKIELDLLKYVDPETQAKEKNKSSPDLSHLVTVKAGDTLPALCFKIYKSAAYCSEVARVNHLNGFRDMAPGTQLFFPPLADE